MTIEQLNIDYGIAGQLKFVRGNGDFPFILINNRNADAVISLYGAQVLSFRPVAEGEDLLFLGQKSTYTEGKAIRGGIPVCWPWFGADPKALNRPDHGFVRNSLWAVAETQASTEFETRVKLRFTPNLQSQSYWQQAFTLELDIVVGNTLTLELVTRNTGTESFSITQAFHAYLQIGSISQVQVLGLENTEYFDKLARGRQKHQQGAITVAKEVDRVYTGANNPFVIEDPVFKRQIKITSTSDKTVAVWNPWATVSATMPDLETNDYRHFICVEAGNIGMDVVEIPPNGECRLLTRFQITRSPL
jgi:glucose-6-phosphate 1-epimerase